MAIHSFGIIIPGRPVDTNFQQVDTNKFLVTIQEAKSVNHIVIFLTSALPLGAVGCIFFSLPDPDASPTWHYLGYLTNEKPSAIYKLNNLTQSKLHMINGSDTNGQVNGIGFNYVQNCTLLVGQVGISIEPFSPEITQMTPAIQTAANSANLFTDFINKTIGNLYNYCSSFSKSAGELSVAVNPFQQQLASATSNQYVPLKCIQSWYENYTRKLEITRTTVNMCDHDHNHHDACCDHGDDGTSFSLYQKINLVNLECLNEVTDGSGARVFKPWSERLSNEPFVDSDCDAELLFNIPFTGDVKLKGIIVRADEELHKMRLFKSSLRMSFDDITAEADQEFEMTHDTSGTYEYPVKPTKFSNVHHLTIHFENRNKYDEDNTCRIYYIGLKGEFSQVNRDGVVIANYELRPTENIGTQIDMTTREVQ